MQSEISGPEISDIIDITGQGVGKIIKELSNEGVDFWSEIRGNRRYLDSSIAREIFERRGWECPALNLIFHTLKGGATKTTLATNCAYRMAQLGAKVLLVDLDKQANATRTLLPNHSVEWIFTDIITKEASIEQAVIYKNNKLAILPSSLSNARLETVLSNLNANPLTYYQSIFAPIRDKFDIIILDLPPDLNRNTFFATCFANTICIPTTPDDYSFEGVEMTLETIRGIREQFSPHFQRQDVFIVWSKFDARKKNAFDIMTKPKKWEPARIMNVIIRSDSTFENAQYEQKTVFEYGKKSCARIDIDSFSQEILGLRGMFKNGNFIGQNQLRS